MTESQKLIEFAQTVGWGWAGANVLVHPVDAELTIKRDPETGTALLSPKLVGLIAMENWQRPEG